MSVYTSRAFIYNGRPGDVTGGRISVECGPRDLVVEVLMCARCGTDKTIYQHGHPNVDPYAPVVLGHELVGRVVEVGSEVHTLTEGIGYRDGDTLPDSYLDFKVGERVAFQSRIARYSRDGLMLIPKPIANAAAIKYVWFSGAPVTPDAVSVGVLALSGVDASGGTYDGSVVLRVAYQPSA